MNKLFISLIMCCFAIPFSLASASDTPELFSTSQLQIAEKLRDNALINSKAWSIVESLTTEVGPRMGGSKGDPRAVLWAEKKFKELDFDVIQKEPVTFPTWIRGKESAQIVSPYQQNLVITALGNSIATPDKGLEGEIVQFNSIDELREVDASKVKGKIVFISKKMPRFRDGHGYGETVGGRSAGATEASKKGAIAILIRSVGTDSNRLAHTGNMSYKDGVKPIPAAALSNPDADLMLNMLKRNKPVVVNMMLSSSAGEEYTSYTVIGEITGSTKPDEVVLLGAHLDSWDLGTGAIDDGAGVAIVMAAAKLIKEMPEKPKRTIRVVLFANEEQGLFGGKEYARAHRDELRKHIVGVESDFGAGKIWKFSTKFKLSALHVTKQIHSVLEPLGIEMGNNKASGGPDIIHSRKAGMAVATLSQDGIDYFDYHHTANDTLDKIDPESLSQNVAAYAAFSWLMAELEGDVGFFPPEE
ncbi:MAG: M20/M25/M40 family metallo-hydrolase [Gammaproteobacteria bacterium]|nr:M20/M25/M40 family metallo-hydrolase [Gammaproteobacteria bacterium]